MNDRQLEFFLSRIHNEGECWVWTGARGGTRRHTYGVYLETTAHRVSYEHFVGPLGGNPRHNVVHHTCPNKLCVNPDHLKAVTQGQNLRLSPTTINAINAAKTHCVRGHEFAESNTYISKTNGQRVCRLCKRDWARAKRANIERESA